MRQAEIAIDPRPKKSAWVKLDANDKPAGGFVDNEELLRYLKKQSVPLTERLRGSVAPSFLVVEDITNMGMIVGSDVFETMFWSGRFCQAWAERCSLDPNANDPDNFARLSRPEIKLLICGSPRAKDANIRQALIDSFGGDEVAIGRKRCLKCKGKGWFGLGRPECKECEGSGWLQPPGPLHAFSGHQWSALAVAVAWNRKNVLEEVAI